MSRQAWSGPGPQVTDRLAAVPCGEWLGTAEFAGLMGYAPTYIATPRLLELANHGHIEKRKHYSDSGNAWKYEWMLPER